MGETVDGPPETCLNFFSIFHVCVCVLSRKASRDADGIEVFLVLGTSLLLFFPLCLTFYFPLTLFLTSSSTIRMGRRRRPTDPYVVYAVWDERGLLRPCSLELVAL
ncbi:hypothetical protein V2G26_005099 [Clonostachys chloroleuca]